MTDNERDTPTVAFRRDAIGFGRTKIRALITIGLAHESEPASEAVYVVCASTAPVVPRRIPDGDPNHAHLRGEDGKLDQRGEFITALGGRDSETRGELVFPCLHQPGVEGFFKEGFEDGRGAAHVRRSAENDGVRGIELRHDLGVVPSPVDNLLTRNAEQMNFNVLDATRALGNGFGDHASMPATRVINDGYACHGGSPWPAIGGRRRELPSGRDEDQERSAHNTLESFATIEHGAFVDSLKQIEVFTQVVAHRSFSRAAERLGVTTSAVSRSMTSLEERLGVRLLHRTTRALNVTEEGAAFHARCLTLLADLEDAERSVSQSKTMPRGTVRVDAPLALGEQVLASALPDFLRRYPDISIELSLRDQFIDPVSEGIDVVLRVGPVHSSGFVAKNIGRVRTVLAGAPSYFARYGRPATPEDLVRHQCLPYLLRGKPMSWPFRLPGGKSLSLQVGGRLMAGSGEVLRRAALAGAGLVYLYEYTLAADLSTGNLSAVLESFAPPATMISAMYTGKPTSRVKAWVDFVAEVFERSPYRMSAKSESRVPATVVNHVGTPQLR